MHKQWLDGATQAQAILAKFDEQLRQSTTQPKPQAANGQGR